MSALSSGGRVLGAVPNETGTIFGVFSSEASSCAVRLVDSSGRTLAEHPLDKLTQGYFRAEVPGVRPGALYFFVLDGEAWPDPYARFLPQGVHGPAEVVEPPAGPRAAPPRWRELARQVIYELHVGTFTEEGTYRAAEAKLPELVELGVTTLELMPLSSFPGRRGWGYDGVAHYAPYSGYGTPEDLVRFIDRAHELGLFVLLDVVYNHFGPSGNYLGVYSPQYFTADRKTPWGDGLAFDEAPLRRYVVDNALYWLEEFGFDGLRLDATHAIDDPSQLHVVREIGLRVTVTGNPKILIVEDERNDPTLIERWMVDGIWADDFHHVVHVLLTGERDGYYAGYEPSVGQLARVIERGWLYEGQPAPPRDEPRGAPADALAASAIVYCVQNHDQIGNRALGERLHHLADLEAYCLASALLLFLPMTPLLFMGQEWAASSPFRYFTDHDPELGAQVSAGRRREFAGFGAFSSEAAREKIPDPQADETFESSRLDWSERGREPHARVLDLYRALLALRQRDEVFDEAAGRKHLTAEARGPLLVVTRRHPGGEARIFVGNFGPESAPLDGSFPADAELLLATRPLEGARLGPRAAAIFAVKGGPEDQRGAKARSIR